MKVRAGPHHSGLSTDSSYRLWLHHVIADYGVGGAVVGNELPPRLLGPEDGPIAILSAYLDINILGCPEASVLSKHVFSAARGFVKDNRVSLSMDTVDRLTIVKNNQPWISSSYQAPAADTAD